MKMGSGTIFHTSISDFFNGCPIGWFGTRFGLILNLIRSSVMLSKLGAVTVCGTFVESFGAIRYKKGLELEIYKVSDL